METKRVSVPADLQARIKYNCRNRCALCAALNNDYSEKQGQIAHIDHNSSHSYDYNNLVCLCLAHHDKYDSTTSQSKNYTPQEILMYKNRLEQYFLAPQNNELISSLTKIVQLLNDGNEYMIYSEVLPLIDYFCKECVFPEKCGLYKWKEQLNDIGYLLQNISNIFNPQFYHYTSGEDKLVFDVSKQADEILENNKKIYFDSLTKLNNEYSFFINSYNGSI